MTEDFAIILTSYATLIFVVLDGPEKVWHWMRFDIPDLVGAGAHRLMRAWRRERWGEEL